MDLAHPMRGAGVGAVFAILPVAVEPAVDAGEHLVRFVDKAKVEWRRVAKAAMTGLAAGIFPPHQKDAIGCEIGFRVGSLDRIDAEQQGKLVPAIVQAVAAARR